MSQPTAPHPTADGYQALAQALLRQPEPEPIPDGYFSCPRLKGDKCSLLVSLRENCAFRPDRQAARRTEAESDLIGLSRGRTALGRGQQVSL